MQTPSKLSVLMTRSRGDRVRHVRCCKIAYCGSGLGTKQILTEMLMMGATAGRGFTEGAEIRGAGSSASLRVQNSVVHFFWTGSATSGTPFGIDM